MSSRSMPTSRELFIAAVAVLLTLTVTNLIQQADAAPPPGFGPGSFTSFEVIEVELIVEEAAVENPVGSPNTHVINCPSGMTAIGGFWRVADPNAPSPVSSNIWQPGYPEGETWVVPTSYRDSTTVAEWQGNTFVRVVCAG